jgi:hypothetical protein
VRMFFTTKSRGLGTGLGMTLVCKFTERAGGAVEIDSAVGRGTTVAIVLPIATTGTHPADPRRAVISLADGRAAAVVRRVLQAAGVPSEFGDDPLEASVWVTVPTAASLRRARAWRKHDHQRQLILFGRPGRRSSREWDSLRPVTIEDKDDLGAIRDAVSRAANGSS